MDDKLTELVKCLVRKIKDLDDEYHILLSNGDITNTKQVRYKAWKEALNWVWEQVKLHWIEEN